MCKQRSVYTDIHHIRLIIIEVPNCTNALDEGMFRQVMVHLSAGILYSYKKGGTRDHKSYHTLHDKSVQRCQKPVQQYLLNCNCSHKCPQERSEPSKLCNVLQYSKRKSSKTHY